MQLMCAGKIVHDATTGRAEVWLNGQRAYVAAGQDPCVLLSLVSWPGQ